MTVGNLHPADEATGQDLLAYFRRRAPQVGVNDRLTLEITRGKNNRLRFWASFTDNNAQLRDEENS